MHKLKVSLFALALVLGIGPPLLAQPVGRTLVIPLMTDYDLDVPTEAADANQIVVSVNLTNVAFTVAASPDVCREVEIIIVDSSASITVGTVAVVGTDCEGKALTWTADISAGAATYSSLDPSESGQHDYYFATVTSVTAADVATLGGGGDETIEVGTTNNLPPIACVTRGGQWPSGLDSNGSWLVGNDKVQTSGASQQIDGVTAANDAFLNVNVGDEIRIANLDAPSNGEDPVIYAVAVTNADDDTITVNIPAVDLDDPRTVPVGYNYAWRDLACGQGYLDGRFDVSKAKQVTVEVRISALDIDSDAGIDFDLLCGNEGAAYIATPVVQQADQTAVTVFSMTATGNYQWCKLGMKFSTTDSSTDTGAEIEKISATAHITY